MHKDMQMKSLTWPVVKLKNYFRIQSAWTDFDCCFENQTLYEPGKLPSKNLGIPKLSLLVGAGGEEGKMKSSQYSAFYIQALFCSSTNKYI